MDAYKTYIAGIGERMAARGTDTEFLWTDDEPDRRRRVRDGQVVVEAGTGDGILNVPGGLIHHWAGAIFVEGATLDDLLAIVQAYDDYPRIHPPVLRAELLERHDETSRIFMRLRKSTKFVTAVFDTWWTVVYHRPSDDRAFSRSDADRVLQVVDAGESDERRLPEGTGGGYLWTANTFMRLLERDGGTYVEFQTVGLSRGFPRLLGWIVEPIVRRIGRGSVGDTLREIRAATTHGY